VSVANIERAGDGVVASSVNGGKHAVSGSCIARIGSASNFVVTYNLVEVALAIRAARVGGALVGIVTSRAIGKVQASNIEAAYKVVALGAVHTSSVVGSVLAISVGVGVIDRARNVVIAISFDRLATRDSSCRSCVADRYASPDPRLISSSVNAVVIAGNVGASSKIGIAVIDGTCDVVIAVGVVGYVLANSFVLTFSA